MQVNGVSIDSLDVGLSLLRPSSSNFTRWKESLHTMYIIATIAFCLKFNWHFSSRQQKIRDASLWIQCYLARINIQELIIVVGEWIYNNLILSNCQRRGIFVIADVTRKLIDMKHAIAEGGKRKGKKYK